MKGNAMKEYEITHHAIEQAQERFNMSASRAKSAIQRRLQSAAYQGVMGDGRVFDHYSTRTRFILDMKSETVITVYSMDTLKTGVQARRVPLEESENRFIGNVKETLLASLEEAHEAFEESYAKMTGDLIADGIESAYLTEEYDRSQVNAVRTYISFLIESVDARIRSNEQAREGLYREYNEMKNATRHLLV